MKRLVSCWVMIFILGLFVPAALFAAPPPLSCRSITLNGSLELPADFPSNQPVLLNMTYQMNYQKNPALLFVNYPLTGKQFRIQLLASPPIVPKKPPMPIQQPESMPESAPSLHRGAESAPESQSSPEPLSLKFVAEKMFLYPREIDFQYFARSQDGSWQSAYLKTHYLHEKKQVDGTWECQSQVSLTPMVLKRP